MPYKQCEGYYNPDKAEERGCNLSREAPDTCKICFREWKLKKWIKGEIESHISSNDRSHTLGGAGNLLGDYFF